MSTATQPLRIPRDRWPTHTTATNRLSRKTALRRHSGYSAGCWPVALLVRTRDDWMRAGFAPHWCQALGIAIVGGKAIPQVRLSSQAGARLVAAILGRRERGVSAVVQDDGR